MPSHFVTLSHRSLSPTTVSLQSISIPAQFYHCQPSWRLAFAHFHFLLHSSFFLHRVPLTSLFLLILVRTFLLREVFIAFFFHLNVVSPFDVSLQHTISLLIKPDLAFSCALPDASASSISFLPQIISLTLFFPPQPLSPSLTASKSFSFSHLCVFFPVLFSHLLPPKFAHQVITAAFSSLFGILLSSERAT